MNFQAFYYVFHVIKWGDILSRDAFLFLLACNKDNRNEKKCQPISCIFCTCCTKLFGNLENIFLKEKMKHFLKENFPSISKKILSPSLTRRSRDET